MDVDLAELKMRLDRLDRQSGTPWVRATLVLLDRYPGINVAAVIRQTGADRRTCVSRMRTLADLGVIERSGDRQRLTTIGTTLLHGES